MLDYKEALWRWARWYEQTVGAYPGVGEASQGTSLLGRLIMRLLRSVTSHNGIGNGDRERPAVGDVVHPAAVWTPVSKRLESVMRGKTLAVHLFLPPGYTKAEGRASVAIWHRDIRGRRYDWKAIGSMGFKLVFKLGLEGISAGIAHWEWAFFCTEGLAYSWRVFRDNVFGKYPERSTPLTIEKRIREGRLTELLPPAEVMDSLGWWGSESTVWIRAKKRRINK